jgi:tetratricopeptide (TPR) repeat protein
MSKSAHSPRQLQILLEEAVGLQQNGAWAEAEDAYREILALRPRHFDALQLLGVLLLQRGRLDEGIELLQSALKIDARHAVLHSNLAYAYNARLRHREALASADRALALKPDFIDALNNRGNALAGLGQAQAALACFDRALALRDDFAPAWNNRACVLRDLARPLEAIASCERAIALDPGYADAWSNRGNALSDLNRPQDAQACYQRALELAPDNPDTWSNYGLTLVDLNRHADALDCYDRALALAPEAAEPHWNKALCLLQLGRLAEGWREYEWRWQRQRIRPSLRQFDRPLWLGDFSVAGKTILLHAEQGLGDTLQFCRYAQDLAQLGAKVLLEVPAELLRLLRGLPGVTQLIEQGAPLPPFDCHCPLLSVPLACATDLSTIPARIPYLQADPASIAQWSARVAAYVRPGALKVGLVWAGGQRAHVAELRKNDARRSMRLAQFRPLFDLPHLQYFSLQMGEPARQLEAVNQALAPGQRIVDLTGEIVDFADTAALVTQLDLVVSVDTSTAHLAGALGRPVYILNRFDTCWRWMLEREDTPWYPSARLFRQPTLGDWDSVLVRLHDTLAALAS